VKILFTGASSFTGFWFVRKLAEAGHEVICPLRSGGTGLTALKQLRLDRLSDVARIIPNSPFGSERFLEIASEGIDLLCHHGAEVGDYRSPDFNVLGALRSNTLNLREVLRATGGKPMMVTGSVFEQVEGVGGGFSGAFSPYGLSKGITWQYLRHYCQSHGVPLGKFVIPNPFGPFEEPRFTAYLMKMWKEGKVAEVKTPDYVRDNIPVDLLAMSYCSFAERLLSVQTMQESPVFGNPSGYIGLQSEFVDRIAREVRKRTGWPCGFVLAKQTDFSEPTRRTNTQTLLGAISSWSEKTFWDEFTDYYQ